MSGKSNIRALRDEADEVAEAEETKRPGMVEQGPNIPVDDDMQRILRGLAEDFGVNINIGNVDLGNLNARIMANAALRLMINKGLVTEEEAGAQAAETLRELLGGLLQALEEQPARAAQEKKAGPPLVYPHGKPVKLARLSD